jgi:hypothetical protein
MFASAAISVRLPAGMTPITQKPCHRFRRHRFGFWNLVECLARVINNVKADGLVLVIGSRFFNSNDIVIRNGADLTRMGHVRLADHPSRLQQSGDVLKQILRNKEWHSAVKG